MGHYFAIAESKGKIIKTAEMTSIAGILATPRISRNGVLYYPDQLAKQNGKTIPIDLEHNHEHTIGTARLIWNARLQRLEYTGRIEDPSLEANLKSGQEYHTSLEGVCQSEEICSENACYTACAENLDIDRMALVMEPGIPETTVQVTEKINNSHTLNSDSNAHKMTETKAVVKEEECPEGKEWDKEAGKCVDKKMEMTPELEKKLEDLGWFRPKKEASKVAVIDPDSTLGKKATETVEDCGCKAHEKREQNPQLTGKAELEVLNGIIESLKALNKEIGERGRELVKEAVKPTATVGVSKEMSILQESYDKFLEFAKNKQIPSMMWTVNKEQWLKEHNYDRKTGKYSTTQGARNFVEAMKLQETITATNVPAISFEPQIILDPTDITEYAARAHCRVGTATQGTDLYNWYTGDAGSAGFGAQTVGTTLSDTTVTVTRQQAQLTKRGMLVKVGYYDVHDIPGDILRFVNEVIGLRAIDDENSFLVGTGTGGWSESGFTPSNWVRGDTGAVITAENVASVVMKREGLLYAKSLIAAQGFKTNPGAQVAIMRPEQHTQLMLDTNLNNYYQFAMPGITQTGVLELLYGVEIGVSNAIQFNDDTNDMWRAVMWTKGITEGFGTDGTLEFEADRRNDVAQVFVSGRHRPIGKRILENSGARISTTK